MSFAARQLRRYFAYWARHYDGPPPHARGSYVWKQMTGSTTDYRPAIDVDEVERTYARLCRLDTHNPGFALVLKAKFRDGLRIPEGRVREALRAFSMIE